MASLPTRLYAAFSAAPFGGNIGGVVYDDLGLSALQRQAIATDLAAPTTGFVRWLEDGAFATHFHSSSSEMDMCGHVTVAAFASLLDDGRITPGLYNQFTRAGVIPIEVGNDGAIWMEQPSPTFGLNPINAHSIASALGISETACISVESASTALKHLFVEVENRAILEALRPSDDGLRALCETETIDTIGVWWLESTRDGKAEVRLRDLCYGIGDPEEAASGTTNGALACLLSATGRVGVGSDGLVRMKGRQGYEMGRPSTIATALEVAQGRIMCVRVGGRAKCRLRGCYELDLSQ